MSSGGPDVDVLVVGSGAAGLCAALSARQAGVSVLVAESEGVVGGSSRLSGGVIMAAGSGVQRAAGIDDDPERMYREYLALNQWQVLPGPVRRFADESGATIDWLAATGVGFHDRLIFGGDETAPRSHVVVGAGEGLVDTLRRSCVEAGIEIALGRRVDRLLTGARVGASAVAGVAVGNDEIRSGSTVLAAGGFGANPDRLARLFPSAWAEERTWYIGAPGSRGDAIDLAGSVGGSVVGHDRGLRTLDPGFVRQNEAINPGWLLLVDGDGRRFVDETAPYGLLDAALRSRGDVAWAVFDDEALHPPPDRAEFYRRAYKQTWPGYPPFEPRNWKADVIDAMVAAGRVTPRGSVAALADDVGCDAATLAGTVERYNRHAEAGRDSDYRKAGRFLAQVATPPFYAVEVRPTVVNVTAAGIRIDGDCRVVANDGQTVPGLFAAGECTGGVLGPVYMGSGNSLGNCTTMGRVAGLEAARSVGALHGRAQEGVSHG